MNWKRFGKIFLSKIFLPKSKSIQCITSQVTSASKINSFCYFMNRQQILQTGQQLTSQCNTCNVSASRQPTSSSNRHQLVQYRITNHCLSSFHSQLAIICSYMARPYFHTRALNYHLQYTYLHRHRKTLKIVGTIIQQFIPMQPCIMY